MSLFKNTLLIASFLTAASQIATAQNSKPKFGNPPEKTEHEGVYTDVPMYTAFADSAAEKKFVPIKKDKNAPGRDFSRGRTTTYNNMIKATYYCVPDNIHGVACANVYEDTNNDGQIDKNDRLREQELIVLEVREGKQCRAHFLYRSSEPADLFWQQNSQSTKGSDHQFDAPVLTVSRDYRGLRRAFKQFTKTAGQGGTGAQSVLDSSIHPR